MDKIELIESGLKCDNPKCDWEDKTISHTEYHNYINSACPKCGENILTEEDYNNSVIFHSTVDLINNMSEEDLQKLYKESSFELFSAEQKREIEENPKKIFTVRFAYMRSGTCRMLKLSTNVSVPFLIYAVTCWCG